MRLVKNINAFNESCSPSSIFKWENLFQEDRFISNLKNSLWNLKMPYFWRLVIKLSYKMQTIPFQDVDLDAKVHLFSTASLWNSTTVVILTYSHAVHSKNSSKFSWWMTKCGLTFRTVSKQMSSFLEDLERNCAASTF